MVVTTNAAIFLGQWQGELTRLRIPHECLRAIQTMFHQNGPATDGRHGAKARGQRPRQGRGAIRRLGSSYRNRDARRSTASRRPPRPRRVQGVGATHWEKTVLFRTPGKLK